MKDVVELSDKGAWTNEKGFDSEEEIGSSYQIQNRESESIMQSNWKEANFRGRHVELGGSSSQPQPLQNLGFLY